MKDQAGSVVGGSGHIRTRKILVISQVALSLVLLVGSGLFIRSLANLKGVDPGFRAERLITFDIAPGLNGYGPEQRASFFRQLQDRLKAVAGVRSAGFARNRLFTGGRWDSNVTVEGYESKPGEDINPYFNAVSPGYLEAMGIPLLAGRDFTAADAGENAKVAIVNQKFVDYFFKGGNAIGRRFATDSGPGVVPDIEIIGVMGNTKYTGVREELQRQVLLPYLRFPPYTIAMTVYIRTAGDPEALFNAVRSEIRSMDPNLPVFELRTLETQISNSLVNERLVASLSAGFGFLATLLAAIGLYGVLAFVVASRTREMGIRMALGALRGDILWIVMREVLLLAGIGIVIGFSAAVALTRTRPKSALRDHSDRPPGHVPGSRRHCPGRRHRRLCAGAARLARRSGPGLEIRMRAAARPLLLNAGRGAAAGESQRMAERFSAAHVLYKVIQDDLLSLSSATRLQFEKRNRQF